MSDKEATARIKINKLLEAAGWRFFPDGNKPANIRLESSVTIKSSDLDALGDNFEKTSKGFVDFLLFDARGFPLIVLEAKSEDKNPLVGKEQARKYAKSQNCRFVILSNGNLHYFWDLERGNPYVVTSFPTPDSVVGYQKVSPNPQRLIEAQVGMLGRIVAAGAERRRSDEVGRLFDRSRMGEQVALQIGALQLEEHRQLLAVLDAFHDRSIKLTVCRQAKYSIRAMSSASRSVNCRTIAGIVSSPASRAARNRRSPATIWNAPAEGRSSTG